MHMQHLTFVGILDHTAYLVFVQTEEIQDAYRRLDAAGFSDYRYADQPSKYPDLLTIDI